MSETQRATAREIAHKHLDSGDPLGWFEDLYSQAYEESSIIPWADLEPNPNLMDWLNQNGTAHSGLAINIGSGLGTMPRNYHGAVLKRLHSTYLRRQSHGTLLVIARRREPSDPEGKMPWPLTKEDLSLFEANGLMEVSLEDFMDNEEPPVRRFKATYFRKP